MFSGPEQLCNTVYIDFTYFLLIASVMGIEAHKNNWLVY